MKATALLTFLTLAATLSARADFSYTSTRRTTGGAMASLAGGGNSTPSKYYFKGQKMKVDNGDTATILDFDAQTITTVDNRRKTISVRRFSDVGAATRQNDVSVNVDVKETGQKKSINGFNASELAVTMDMDSPELKQVGGKMQMEMDMWLSADVPGAGELRGFYKKNMERMPWAALSGGAGNPSLQAGLAEMQRKVAEMNGVPVLEVIKVKPAGGAAAAAMPQMTAAQSAQMQAAMEKLKAMQQQGGPAAAAAAQAMARMGAMPGAASGSLVEITMESSDFSTASIPDSLFAIPAGYEKMDLK